MNHSKFSFDRVKPHIVIHEGQWLALPVNVCDDLSFQKPDFLLAREWTLSMNQSASPEQ